MNPILLYDSRFMDGTPTATDTASGYNVLNIRDYRTYTHWKAASAGTKYITIDCGSAKSADALGMISHNLKTANASISVESSNDNFAANIIERLAPFTPATDNAFMKLFTSASDRYWRIKIVTASIAPQIGVIALGQKLLFPIPLQNNFDPATERIVAESNRGKKGHRLGTVVSFLEIGINARFSKLDPSWVASNFKPAWDSHLSALKPFFWAWEMDNHADEVYFVSIPDDGSLSMPYESVTRSLNLEMEGAKEE